MIVYKCIYLKSPTYLKDLLTYRIESRHSRSSNSNILRYHMFRHIIYGKRSFRHSAAALWNGQHRDLKLFTFIQRFKNKVKDCIIDHFSYSYIFINLTILFFYLYIILSFIYLCIIILLKHK